MMLLVALVSTFVVPAVFVLEMLHPPQELIYGFVGGAGFLTREVLARLGDS